MADKTIPAFKILRGSVGVGTTLPSSTFHVYSDSSTNTIINLQGGSATNKGAYMNFFRGTTNVGALGTKASLIGGTSNDMMFYSASNDWIFYSTGERMRVQADGLVGIGTNAPATLLHLEGSAVKLRMKETGAETWDLYAAGSRWAVRMDDADKLTIADDGSVGIGTETPAVPLHVYTNSASGQEIMLQNDGSGEVGFILRTDRKSNGALTGWIGFDAHDAGDNNTRYATIEAYSTDTSGGSEDGALRFSVMAAGSDVESMTIAAKSGTSDIGWVGVGTNAPSFPFQVLGVSQTNGDAKRVVCILDSTSAAAGTGAGIALGGYTNGTASTINDFAVIQRIKENGTAGNYASAMLFSTRANGANPTERMRITSSGSVGIGTNNPNGFFQVGTVTDSSTTASSLVHLLSATASSTVNGFSTLKLDYKSGHAPSTAGAQIMFNQGYHSGNQDYTAPVGSIRGWKTGASDNYGGGLQFLYQPDSGALGLLAGMTLEGSGHVGIGTNAPAYPLHVYYAGGAAIGMQVKGTANRAKLVVTDNDTSAYVIAEDSHASFGRQDSLSTNNLNINSDGSVGIGTNAASTFCKLNVKGAVRLGRGSDDLGSYNGDDFDLFVGYGANGSKIMLYDDQSAYHSALIQYGNALLRIGLNNSNSAPSILDASAINIIPAGVGIGIGVFTARLAVKSAGSTTDQIVVVHSGNSVEIAQLGQSANGSSAGTLLLKNNGGTDKIYLDAAGSSYFRGGSITVGVDDTGHDVRLYGATSGRYWEWDESQDLVRHRNNVKATWGDGDDLQLFHDGTNSYIQNGANGGHLSISLNGGLEYSALFLKDDAVKLFFNGVQQCETLSNGLKINNPANNIGYLFGGDGEILAGQDSGGYYYATGSGQNVSKPVQIGSNASYIKFKTANTERVRITSTGLVGIGTASALASSGEQLAVYSASTGHSCFKNSSDGTGTVYIRNASQTANTWQPYLILADSGGNRGGLALKYSTSGLKVHGQGGIEFWTGSSFGGGTVKLTIASNGTVTQAGGAYEWYDGSGAKVGEISTIGGNNLTISGTQTNHCGLSFATNAILPATQSATNNNTVDLGANGNAFKDFYIQGTAYVRNSGGNNILWGKGTGWGYSPNAYKAVQIGDASGNFTVSIGYDPATNPSGAFTGDGTELLFKNDFSFVTPNAANNGWHYCMHFKDGNIGIGVNAPTSKLHVTGDTGNSAFLAYIYNSGTQSEDNGLNVQVASSGASCYALRVNTGGDATTLVATGSGNVGIGYTPSNITEKFCVNGKTRLQSSGDGNNVLECIDSAGDAMFNIRQSSNDCLIRAYKDGGTQTIQLHSDGESYLMTAAGGGTDLQIGGSAVTSHGTVVMANGTGASIAKIRVEGSDDSFQLNKIAGGGLFNFTSNTSFQFDQNVKLQTTDHVILDLSTPSGNNYTMLRFSPNGTQASYIRAQTNGDVIFDNSSGTLRMKMSNNGFIQIGNNLPVWSGSYGGALLLKGNNSTSDRYAQLTTVDSSGAVTNTGLIVKSGDVGIGTNAPARALDVDGRVLADTYGFRSDTSLRWYYFDNYSGSNFMGRGGNAFTSLYDGGTLSMVWKGGSVGIGTNNPTQQLVVAKSNSGGIGGSIRIDNLAGAAADKTQLIFSSFGNSYHRAMIQCTVESSAPFGGTLEFYTGISSGTFTEKMRVDHNGNVGIGTDNPANKLQVKEASDITPTSGGAGQFAVQGNGYTTFLAMDGTAAYFGHNSSGRHLRLMTNETTRLAIDGGGTYIHSYTHFLPVSNGSYSSGLSSNRWSNTYSVLGNFSSDVTISGNVGINGFGPSSSYGLQVGGNAQVAGSFSASSKSFLIDHPTKENKKLEHGSLEGPEFGVYYRGRAQSDTITLPDYWTALVREETITVQLTSNGSFQHLYVVSQSLTEIVIGAADGETIDCFYTIYGERADIDSLVVEKEV